MAYINATTSSYRESHKPSGQSGVIMSGSFSGRGESVTTNLSQSNLTEKKASDTLILTGAPPPKTETIQEVKKTKIDSTKLESPVFTFVKNRVDTYSQIIPIVDREVTKTLASIPSTRETLQKQYAEKYKVSREKTPVEVGSGLFQPGLDFKANRYTTQFIDSTKLIAIRGAENLFYGIPSAVKTLALTPAIPNALRSFAELPYTEYPSTAFKFLITDPAKFIYTNAKDPVGIADIATSYGISYGVFKTGSIIGSEAKNQFVTIGAKFKDPNLVWSKQVTQQGKTFPIDTSGANVLASFQKSREFNKVTRLEGYTGTGTDLMSHEINLLPFETPSMIKTYHATPGGFKFGVVDPPFISIRKGDLGGYVTPKSVGASPFFTYVGRGASSYSLSWKSLNPFANFNLKNPAVIEIGVTNVERLPMSVIKSKGYLQANIFEQAQAGLGKAFVSARSEKGFLGINEYINIGGKSKRVLTTHEIEAVIPKGTSLTQIREGNWFQRLKGYTEYTTYEGKNIPIIKAQTNKLQQDFITNPFTKTQSRGYIIDKNIEAQIKYNYYGNNKVTTYLPPAYTNKLPNYEIPYKYPQTKISGSYAPPPQYKTSQQVIKIPYDYYPVGSSKGSGSYGGGISTPYIPPYTPPPYTPPYDPPKYNPPSYTPPYYPPIKYTPNYNPPPFTPPGNIFLGLGNKDIIKSKKLKTRKKTEYYPDFSSLWKGLKGTYKGGKLAKSGIDFRPITKKTDLAKIAGFKTNRGFKL